MKALLLALALIVPTAHAVDVEISLGASRFTYLQDGMWYQEGMPHSNRMTSPAASVGLVGDVLPNLQWRAGYAFLGSVSSDAMAAPDMTDYHDGVGGYDPGTRQCRGSCGPQRRFVGRGYLHGLYLTLQPYVDVKGYRLAVEGGPFFYHAQYHVTAYNTDGAPQWIPVETFKYRAPAVEVGWLAGASVSRGPWSVAYQFYHVPSKWRPDPTIWKNVHLLSVRYRF